MSLYVLYVALLNVFLSTSLFETVINQDPETIDIHYRKGWTIFPGRIHARDLSIRSSDSNVEWILRLDEVEFDLSFVGLARRRFEVSRARGHGISMRARQKLSAWPDSAEEIKDLPPIDGFPAFSIRPAGPPSLERWFDAHYELWTVRLDDVIAEHVREVWVDSGRFEGDARIAGGFYLKPIRSVVVGPAHVDVRPGSRVTVGRSVVVAGAVAGTVDVTIDRFDPRAVDGASVFRHFTVATELKATFADPATLPFALPGGLYVSTDIEARRLALNVRRGVVSAGTRVELGSPRALVAKENVIGAASFDLVAEVAKDGASDRLRADLEMRGVALDAADGTSILRARRLAVAADARELDLAHDPLRDAHAVVDLPDAELADASVLDYYFPKDTPFAIIGGSGRTNAHVELFPAEKRASGSANLQADALDVRLAKMRVRGSFGVAASFGAYRWESNDVEDATLAVIVSQGKLASERDASAPKVETRSLNVEMSSRLVDLDDPMRSFDARFSMPEASIVDVTMLSPYLPKGNMKVVRGRSYFELDGHVTVEDHVARGELHARSKSLGLELGDVHLRASVDARARIHDWHWEHGDVAIDDATVDATGVSISRGKDPTPLASIERIAVGVRSPSFAFADPLACIDIAAKIAGGVVSDPAAVDAFLPDGATYGLDSDDGTFQATARLSIRNHVARGEARAKAQGMGVRSARFSVHGDTDVAVDVGRWDIEAKKVKLGPSRLAITSVHGRFGGNGSSDVTAEGIELTGMASDLDIARPSLRGVDARFVLDSAELPDARALQFLVPAGDGMRIESGSARAFGTVAISSSAHTGAGTLEVDIARGGLAVHQTRLAGDFAFRAKLGGFDPNTTTFDLSGSSLEMRDVQVNHAAAETTRWRGDVVLEKATLRLGGPEDDAHHASPQLDGIVRVDADDARPLLGVLLRDSVPKVVAGLATMPRLRGYARVRLSPHAVLISDISASGGDVAIRGSYGLYGKDRRGAFVVEKGPFSVGLGLDEDGASPRFFNLDVWLGDQVRTVKAKAAAAKAVPEAQREKNDAREQPDSPAEPERPLPTKRTAP